MFLAILYIIFVVLFHKDLSDIDSLSSYKSQYSQICLKRQPKGQKKMWSLDTGELQ